MRPCRLSSVPATLIAVALFVISPGGGSFVSEAQAQKGGAGPDYATAKKHYAAAEKAAGAKKWDEAAKEYGVAYEITKDPVLFFKLGNAYQLSGDCTRAVEYFERYLEDAKPSAEYQADTKSRISTCQSSLATSTNASSGSQDTGDADPTATSTGNSPLEPSLTGDSDPSEETGSGDELANPALGGETQPSFMDEEATWQQTAGWTSVGVSVAFLTASAVLGLSANSREEDIDNLISYRDADGRPANFDANIQDRYETLADEGDSLNTMSLIALGGAGLSAAAAIVFFVLDSSADQDEGGLASLKPAIDVSAKGNRSVGFSLQF